MNTSDEALPIKFLPTQGASDSGLPLEAAVADNDWQERVLAAFEKRKRFDFSPLVKRYAKEYGLSQEESEEHIDEMCRFLCLAGLNHQPYSMMGPVDHAWHTFILFTKMYTEFCAAISGKYIHHNPGEMLTGNRESYVAGYGNLLADYERAFEVKPPAHIWPQLATTAPAEIECISCNCETCSPYYPPCD
ncbi:hypothetical protein [Mesorhizobium sp.]|uniref:glycine-rich domain-containing protein n=1 Tax=Mesorhizobium sp. TaxID=1871066 RepID=UPI000FE9A467|nr:hypothetical protein [Mesorhizobium sp.]RWD70273.1 MAG: hypothetical protein EOS37_15225 [Mesorhizobium sp.]